MIKYSICLGNSVTKFVPGFYLNDGVIFFASSFRGLVFYKLLKHNFDYVDYDCQVEDRYRILSKTEKGFR